MVALPLKSFGKKLSTFGPALGEVPPSLEKRVEILFKANITYKTYFTNPEQMDNQL